MIGLGKGIGKYQIDKATTHIMTILRALSDKQEHQYSELRDKTKLNSPTLAKHLKRLVKQKFIEKRVDLDSGKYPYPVYYKINTLVVSILEVIETLESETQEIERVITNCEKTPLDVLNKINVKFNAELLGILKICRENRDVSVERLNFLLELIVWYPYRHLTFSLIESSRKIIEKIDIQNLIKLNKGE